MFRRMGQLMCCIEVQAGFVQVTGTKGLAGGDKLVPELVVAASGHMRDAGTPAQQGHEATDQDSLGIDASEVSMMGEFPPGDGDAALGLTCRKQVQVCPRGCSTGHEADFPGCPAGIGQWIPTSWAHMAFAGQFQEQVALIVE